MVVTAESVYTAPEQNYSLDRKNKVLQINVSTVNRRLVCYIFATDSELCQYSVNRV